MKLKPLSIECMAGRDWTHEATIAFDDPIFVAATGTNVGTVVLIPDVGVGATIEKAAFVLDTAFNSSDATLISLTALLQLQGVTVLAATEVSVDGTTVADKRTDTPVVAAAATDDLRVLFTGTAAKNLSTLTTGSLRVYFRLNQARSMVL